MNSLRAVYVMIIWGIEIILKSKYIIIQINNARSKHSVSKLASTNYVTIEHNRKATINKNK